MSDSDTGVSKIGIEGATEGDFKLDIGMDHKIRVLKDAFWRIEGKVEEWINNSSHQTIVGWTSRIIGGFKKELIGGFNTSVVCGFNTSIVWGADTKLVKGVWTLITNGVAIRSHKGPFYQDNPKQANSVRGPMYTQVKGIAKQFCDRWRAESKHNTMIKAAERAELEAKNCYVKADKKLWWHSENEILMDAAKAVLDAKKIRIEAEKNLVQALVDFNNGTLKVKR